MISSRRLLHGDRGRSGTLERLCCHLTSSHARPYRTPKGLPSVARRSERRPLPDLDTSLGTLRSHGWARAWDAPVKSDLALEDSGERRVAERRLCLDE